MTEWGSNDPIVKPAKAAVEWGLDDPVVGGALVPRAAVPNAVLGDDAFANAASGVRLTEEIRPGLVTVGPIEVLPNDFMNVRDGVTSTEQFVDPSGRPITSGMQATTPEMVRAIYEDAPDRTLGEIASDQGEGFRGATRRGLASLIEAPVNLANLAMRVWGGLPGVAPAPVIEQPEIIADEAARLRGEAQEILEGRSRTSRLGADAGEATEGFIDAAAFYLTHPGASGDLGAEIAGQMYGAGITPNPTATIATQALSAGSSARDEVFRKLVARGMDPQEAAERADMVFGGSAAVNMVLPKLVRGGAVVERVLAGRAGQTGGSVAARTLTPMLGEPVSEGGAEGAEQLIKNLALGDPAMQDVGKTTAIGSLFGAATGVPAGIVEGLATPQGDSKQGPEIRIPAEAFDRTRRPDVPPADAPPSDNILAAGNAAPATDDLDALIERAIPAETLAAVRAELGMEDDATPAEVARAAVSAIDLSGDSPAPVLDAERIASVLGDIEQTPAAPSEPASSPAVPAPVPADGAAATNVFTQRAAAAMRQSAQERAARTAAPAAQSPAVPDGSRPAGGDLPAPLPSKPSADPTMQNRDRSRAASVAQMQDIRRNPDPDRLGFSRDPNTGAPMVSEGRQVPDADKGRADSVVMASGRRVPVRYAVVEADDLAASHDADGNMNPGYDTAPLKALNNGRTAGLQAAYAGGSAGAYRQGIAADAALHGVSPEAIASKRSPVLVRLYDPALNTGDMGAESNASQQLGMSPVEQAQTDARALPDLAGITWAEDGSLPLQGNVDFFRGWFHNMGDTQAASLQDSQGRPNAAAIQRVRAAMVHRAYGDERLLTAMAEEVNPNNRNVMNALVQAAPAFATLEQDDALTGEIRDALVGGLEVLRDAAARGLSTTDAIAQGDLLGRNPNADAVAAYMAANARSAKRMAEAFKALAEYADRGQAQAATLDVFGTAPTPTVRGALNAAGIETDAGPSAEPADAGDRARQPTESGRAAAGDAFALEGQAPTEAPREVAPTQGGGLFGAPSTRDFVDAARRDRDAARNGRAGTGRTDMAAGDGELFAGPRPEQADVEPPPARASRSTDGLKSAEATDPGAIDRGRTADAEVGAQGSSGSEFTVAQLRDAFNGAPLFREEPGQQSPARQRTPEQSAALGEEDAERLGLRGAVDEALAGAAVRVEFLRGLEGLPDRLRRGVERRLAERDGKGRTAALYDPVEKRVFVFTDVVTTADRAIWNAAHEVAGHHGLRELLGERLDRALEVALQNPTVATVADAIARERNIDTKTQRGRLLAAEEALAELSAAVRTGNFAEIESRYGVPVPEGVRERVTRAIENFLKRLKAAIDDIFGRHQFTDEDVRALLEAAWQAARQPVSEGRAGAALESAEGLEAVEASDHRLPDRRGLSPAQSAGLRLAEDDVRRADRNPLEERGVIANARQDIADQIEEARQFANGRPKNPQSLVRRANGARAYWTDAIVSRARSLTRRNPQSKALRELFNRVMNLEPGADKVTGEILLEATARRYATFTNRARNIIADTFGSDRLNERQNARLRKAMLTDGSSGDAEADRAAKRLRKLMDTAKEDMIAAGIEVGEVEDIGYLTRLYDDAKILDDEDGFKAAATKLYRDHEFDKEIGKSGRAILYGDGTLPLFVNWAKRAGMDGDPIIKAGLSQLKTELQGYRTQSNVGGQNVEIIKIIDTLLPRVRQFYGATNADSWLHKIATPTAGQVFNGIGPSGAPVTKGRALSGAADTVMADYLKTDMFDILDTYARVTSKKIAMAERFGPKGEKVDELLGAARREGVKKPDLDEAQELAESAMGNFSAVSERAKGTIDALQAWGTLTLLGRVVFASVAEPITFAMRTGQMRHVIAPLTQVWRAVGDRKRGKELRDFAVMLGVNGNKAMEVVMQNQLGGDYGMTPRWAGLVGKFMEANLLSPLTRAQRAYGVGAANGFLRYVAQNVADGKRLGEMGVYLNELGIADHAAFSTWMLAQGGLPNPSGLYDSDGRPTPRGQDYIVAVRRLVDQAIQNPNASHRPQWQNSPAGRVFGGIMGFSYAAYENVIKAELRRIKTIAKVEGVDAAAARASKTATGALALIFGQTIVGTIREALFNPDRFDDKDEEELYPELMLLGLQRSFGLGSLDPVVQLYTGLKYQRSSAETILGAYIGTAAKTADRFLNVAGGQNSPNTDTAEYRAAESVYSSLITPVANALLSRVPLAGGPLIMASSSGQARRKFAGLFFDQPEPRTKLDDDYQAMQAEMTDLTQQASEQLRLKPVDQWAEEFERLREAYPDLLAGASLELYKRDGKYGRAGEPKRNAQGEPVIDLTGGDEAGGSVMGELQGYTGWRTRDGKRERYKTQGIEDRITALNKAIRQVRGSDDLTYAGVFKVIRDVPSELPQTLELAREFDAGRPGALDTPEAQKEAPQSVRRTLLRELQEARQAEKRRALEIIEEAKSGKPITRSR